MRPPKDRSMPDPLANTTTAAAKASFLRAVAHHLYLTLGSTRYASVDDTINWRQSVRVPSLGSYLRRCSS